jgi:hypothetical protein
VIECRHGSDFPLEAIAEALACDFDGDVTAHTRIVGAVDLAHTSRTDSI